MWTGALLRFSSSTGPTARSRPSRMTAAPAHRRSASSRLWVVRKTVVPSFAVMAARSFLSEAEATGSSPAVGSSRKTRRGRWIRVRATASFCFMPRLQPPIVSARLSHRPKWVRSSRTRDFRSPSGSLQMRA